MPGASVALIAREHEVNANLVFKWRRHYREGQLGPVAHQVTLLPVNLSKAPTPSAEEAMPLPSSPGGLVVECGRVTLRIEGVPDPQTCNWSCSRCCDDCPAHRDSHLDRGWSHRHAAGFDGLAALVQTQLEADPFSGQIFVFRGRRGDRIKLLWWDGDGLCLFCKRRAGALRLAASHQRQRLLDDGTTRDAVGGHRLAPTAAHRTGTSSLMFNA